MNTYTIKYRRIEDGWWLATVDEVQGCLTQGRTINQTRRRAKEALSLFVDNIDNAQFVDKIELSATVQRALDQFNIIRTRANKEMAKLQDSANTAATILINEASMSLRDAAELLGLSHQRIHQIVEKSRSYQKQK